MQSTDSFYEITHVSDIQVLQKHIHPVILLRFIVYYLLLNNVQTRNRTLIVCGHGGVVMACEHRGAVWTHNP